MIRSMNDWRKYCLLGLLVVMLCSIFFSRAILSIAMIAFVVVSFFHSQPGKQILQFFREPLLWSMSILFFLPLISGLWSEDQAQWYAMVQLKLPLFVLPLAFAAPFGFKERQWELLLFIFVCLVAIGTFWSTYHYLSDVKQVNESYLRAKSLLTPLENDHVRFSWMVNASILGSGWLLYKFRNSRNILITGCILISWFIIYLHILAARTGLIGFYLGLLVILFFIKNRKLILFIVLVIPLLTVLAYFFLPTFQNRVRYFKYDMSFFKAGNYLPGANDAVRVMSLKAGYQVMAQHPLHGVGFGDVKTEADEWYIQNYPLVIERDKIYPSSEWMMYGAATGWIGLIIFSACMLIPFFTRINYRVPWLFLVVTLIFSLLFDIGLSVQFGVFLFAYSILVWWKYLSQENPVNL